MLSDFQAVQVLLGQVVAESVLLLKRAQILSQRYFPYQHEIFGVNHRLDVHIFSSGVHGVPAFPSFVCQPLLQDLIVNQIQCARQSKQGTDPGLRSLKLGLFNTCLIEEPAKV